jgi:hypothetical protein
MLLQTLSMSFVSELDPVKSNYTLSEPDHDGDMSAQQFTQWKEYQFLSGNCPL